ncbi:MAG: DUF6090 family protein [Robiginitalea sp.]|nr:DUF6090 family protein [Robiginitalea sp.]
MFSLMRNLRRTLIESNSVGKYLLYAFGEVVLIVLGILAALWIDNWNQERQEMKREQFYLSGLKDEFLLSLRKLDTLIAVNRETYQTSRQLLRRIPATTSPEEEAGLSRLLIETLSYEIAYNPNNSLLAELIGSGRLETLSDPQLRNHLTSWAPSLESVHRQEGNLRMQRERTLDLWRGPEGSIRTILVHSGVASGMDIGQEAPLHSNLPVLKSRAFENNLLLFMLAAVDTEEAHYDPLRREIEHILGLIEAGLE